MKKEETASLHAREIINVIFKRKWQICLIFFLTVGISGLITFNMDPTYEASTLLLVKVKRNNLLVSPVDNQNTVVSLDQDQFINSEIEILKGDSLIQQVLDKIGGVEKIYPELVGSKKSFLDKVIMKLGLEDESQLDASDLRMTLKKKAVIETKKNLDIEPVTRSNIIKVKFQHKNPYLASDVPNKLANVYIDRHLDIYKSKKSYQFFLNQANLLKNRVEQSEKQLYEMKKLYNITNFEEQRNIMLRQKTDLQATFNETISLENESKKKVTELKKQLRKVPAKVSSEQQGDINQQLISTLHARLVELEIQKKDLTAKYTDDSRLVTKVQEEIRLVKEKLNDYENRKIERSTLGINPLYQLLKQDLFRYETEREALEAKRITLTAQIKEYERQMTKFNDIESEYFDLVALIQADKDNYDLYLKKLEESRITDAMDTEKISNVSIVELATPPIYQIKPKKSINMIVATFAGAIIGLFMAFFSQYISNRIDTREDIERYLKIKVLTSIPERKTVKLS